MVESEQAPIAPGDILAGKYRVDSILGAGGMGVVVAATHVQLDQRVALKFVLPTALHQAEAVERFFREARASVRLKSEHVRRVLDVGKLENGAPFMVMELLEGTDLATFAKERGPLDVALAVELVAQACEGLAEAHALGIVHRDLKPRNLFVTTGPGGAPFVKVLDFGISKIIAPAGDVALTKTATLMGSPLYMSPEQMRCSRDVDVRSDVWALGVILYELLTGRVPFECDSVPALCLKVANDPTPPLAQKRADIPLTLVAIVGRCLEKDPARRFADAMQLGLALRPYAQSAQKTRPAGVDTDAPWSGTGPHANRGGGRRVGAGVYVLAIFAALAVVGAIGAAFGLKGRASSNQAPPPTTPATLTSGTPVTAPTPTPPAPDAQAPPLASPPEPPAVPTMSAAPRPASRERPAPPPKPRDKPAPDDEIPSFRR